MAMTVQTMGIERTHEHQPTRDRPRLSGRFVIQTYGCQMNEHDSEKMRGLLEAMGMTPAGSPEEADLVLINTCSIREKAGQKVFSELGRLKRVKQQRPHMVIGLCGCLAQQEGEGVFRRAPHVDLVFGPRNIPDLPDLLRRALVGERRLVSLSRPRQQPAFDGIPVHRRSRVTGYVTIMEGCDKFCTFCIVPFTRGRETYRPPREILMEVQTLAEAGYPEVILLGQTVNSYQWEDVTFAALLRMIHQIDGIRRIRFVSPHPADVTDELIATMRDYPKICRHIHMPLQSGSDRILKAMRRSYTVAAYMDRIERLRAAIPDIAVSTDIIVGFPGETDEDFEATMRVVEAVRFDSMFSFKYSPRPFTAAWKFGDPIEEPVKTERLVRLQTRQNEIQLEKNRELIGTIQEVLFEGRSRKRADELEGRTTHNRIVNTPASADEWLGQFARVRVTDAGPNSLRGELLEAFETVSVDARSKGS